VKERCDMPGVQVYLTDDEAQEALKAAGNTPLSKWCQQIIREKLEGLKANDSTPGR